MKKILYSKFSNERNSQYAIETSIFLDEQGDKWVRKAPMFAEGKKHFENIVKSYDGLCEMFPKEKLQIQPYVQEQSGLLFPFICGDTMESLLHLKYQKEGYTAMLSQIKEYFSFILRYSSNEEFQKTDRFVEMFGDVDIEEGTKCGKYNNLDYGFANVIVSEAGNTLIDYEWTVDFPVPVDFLLYRCLHYFVYTSSNSVELLEHHIFADLGFAQERIQKYTQMELRFQKYISSDMITIGELYPQMGQNIDNINILHQYYHKYEGHKIQIYYDYGEGFIHENSFFVKPEIDEEGVETVCISDIPANALRVRIDPQKEKCIVRLFDIVNENGEDMIPTMESNGNSTMVKDIYLFNVQDPWFVITHNHSSKLIIRFSLRPSSYVSELREIENQIQQSKQHADEMEHLYHEVIESRSWKITKPLRNIYNSKR